MNKKKTDIEINQAANLKPISEIASKLKIKSDNIITLGKHQGKLLVNTTQPADGKLILITSINPTPAGEGKTTIAIGLNDALCSLGKKSVLALREPSMGPVFGRKGGATGGGYAQIAPIANINLHFTGDFHAISTANNLIAASIDSSIYWGNELDIKKVLWKRCIDLNDRSLREIEVKVKKNMYVKTGFQITAASEIMAIISLSANLNDLKSRLNKVIVALNGKNEPIFLKQLDIVGSIVVLLKDAILPNMVQTLENNLALIHCGPFANIAHGCNSVIATKEAMKIGDYVITEAGFGSDLGAEKFINIKSRVSNITPNLVILVVTIRALKFLGGQSFETLSKESINSLEKGFALLEKHLSNIKTWNLPFILTLNEIKTDTENEKNILKDWADKNNISLVNSKVWEHGGKGGEELAKEVIKLANSKNKINHTYEINESIKIKIKKIAEQVYGATNIVYTDDALKDIEFLERNKLDKQYICMARTPSSLSNDPKSMGLLKEWTLTIKGLSVSNGAGFIVVYCGNVMTMPGLSREPQAKKIDLIDGKVVGLD